MRSTTTPNPVARDIQNVVSDAQDLLKTVQDQGENKLSEMRGKVQAQIDAAHLGELVLALVLHGLQQVLGVGDDVLDVARDGIRGAGAAHGVLLWFGQLFGGVWIWLSTCFTPGTDLAISTARSDCSRLALPESRTVP